MGTSPRNRAARLHHVLGQSREEHVDAHSAIREGGTVSESGDTTLLRRVFTRPDTAYSSLRRSIEERISPSSGKYHRQNPPENESVLDAARGLPKSSRTWVVGDAPALGETASSSSSKSHLALHEPPFPPTMEMPEVATLDLEQPMISMEVPATSPSATTTAHNDVGPPETELSTTIESLPTLEFQTFDDLKAFFWEENSCD